MDYQSNDPACLCNALLLHPLHRLTSVLFPQPQPQPQTFESSSAGVNIKHTRLHLSSSSGYIIYPVDCKFSFSSFPVLGYPQVLSKTSLWQRVREAPFLDIGSSTGMAPKCLSNAFVSGSRKSNLSCSGGGTSGILGLGSFFPAESSCPAIDSGHHRHIPFISARA